MNIDLKIIVFYFLTQEEILWEHVQMDLECAVLVSETTFKSVYGQPVLYLPTLVELSCGGMTNENCTYLMQEPITSTPEVEPCIFTICKCASNICRIRFDFNVRDFTDITKASTHS